MQSDISQPDTRPLGKHRTLWLLCCMVLVQNALKGETTLSARGIEC